jgi:hypothetical protein
VRLHFTAERRHPAAAPETAAHPDVDWRQLETCATTRRDARAWVDTHGCAGAVARTARSQHIGSTEQLAQMVAEVKDIAGDHAGELEFCTAYSDEALMQPTVDVQRHRDALG